MFREDKKNAKSTPILSPTKTSKTETVTVSTVKGAIMQ